MMAIISARGPILATQQIARVAMIAGDQGTEQAIRRVLGSSAPSDFRRYAEPADHRTSREARIGLIQALQQALEDGALPLLVTLGPLNAVDAFPKLVAPQRRPGLLIIGDAQKHPEADEGRRWLPHHLAGTTTPTAIVVQTSAACSDVLDAALLDRLTFEAALDRGMRFSPTLTAIPPLLTAPNIGPSTSDVPGTFNGAPIYWINLDRRADRREHMETLLHDWAGPTHRVTAVDGSHIDTIDVRIYGSMLSRQRQRFTRQQHRGELGCTRSHQRVMRMAIAADQYPFVVFEDDVLLSQDWWRDTPPADWKIAMLGGRPPRDVPPLRGKGWLRLNDPRWITTHAYAVRDRHTALALLHAWSEESAPADVLWWRAIQHCPTYASNPRRVDVQKSASDIHGATPPASRQRRRRPLKDPRSEEQDA